MRREILMVTAKVTALWDMTLRRPSDTEQFLRGICRLHHQGPSVSNLQHFFTKKLLWTYLTTLILCVSLSHFQTAMTLKLSVLNSCQKIFFIAQNHFNNVPTKSGRLILNHSV